MARPKNFRDHRSAGRHVQTTEAIEKNDLVRPCDVCEEDYAIQKVCLADADWDGPLYVALETRRAGAKTFVCEYGCETKSPLVAPNGTPVFLGDGGTRVLNGRRVVGVLIGNGHAHKGPMVHLAPGQCNTIAAAPAPAPKRARKPKKAPAPAPAAPQEE